MSDGQLLVAWNRGQSLLRALLSFASESERDAILSEEPSLVWGVLKAVSDVNLLANSKSIPLKEASGIVMLKGQETQALVRAAKKRLFEQLEAEKYIVIGFEPPRRMESKPLQIPFDYLRAVTDWNKNQFKYESLEFVDVRVVEAAFLDLGAPALSKTSKSGRKSRQTYYFECFRELEKQGRLDPKRSKKEQFAIVREWLSENYPEIFLTPEVGSDKTIYRYFRSFLSVSNVK